MRDDPFFQCGDKGAHVLAPALEVEHDIGHALAWPMIGVFATTAGREDGKAIRLDQVLDVGAGAGRIKRRVLDEPDKFGSGARPNSFSARFHEGKCVRVGGQAVSMRHSTGAEPGEGRNDVAIWLRSGHGSSECQPLIWRQIGRTSSSSTFHCAQRQV